MTIYGLGSHVVECLRIAQLIERHAELFVNRVYTQHEIEFCSTRRMATQQYAAHWAAKEAVIKAIGIAWAPGIHWRDVEIRIEQGRPTVRLGGGAREACEARFIGDLQVTLSSCRTHAVAFAIAVLRDLENEIDES